MYLIALLDLILNSCYHRNLSILDVEVIGFMKILLITMLLFFSAWVNAGIYKWTDENGKVHYGDKPTTSSERLNISLEKSNNATTNNANTGDETREERRQRISDSMTEDRLARDKKKSEDKQKKADKKRQCNQSKDSLRNYKKANRLYDLNKEGGRDMLSDASRKKAISNLEKEIRRNCR